MPETQENTPKKSHNSSKRNSLSLLVIKKSDVQSFFRKNWLNLLVLAFALGVSAAATAISHTYANDSIRDLSLQLSRTVLSNTQNQIVAFLNQSTSVIPVAKQFISDNSIDLSGPTPDIRKAATLLGKFYRASGQTSLFYVAPNGNNLGWGKIGPMDSILLVWPSIVNGSNFYIPVNGTIGNYSTPIFSDPTIPAFPPLEMARKTGTPIWGAPFFLATGTDQYLLLIPYVEPIYNVDTNEFAGIVGANIIIEGWESALAGYQIGKSGKIFITNADGLLLADSNAGAQLARAGTGFTEEIQLPHATQNEDPLLAEAAKYLEKIYGSLGNIPERTEALLEFQYKDETIWLLAGFVTLHNFKLYTVIVVPKLDFTGNIDKSTSLTIGLTVAASVLGALRYMPWSWFYSVIMKNRRKTDSVEEIPRQHAFA